MILPTLEESAKRGELIIVDGGMCRFHKRKDGVVTIYEIIVLPEKRYSGIGRSMLLTIIDKHEGCKLRAVCPIGYESNGFWAAEGFEKMKTAGNLNTWELNLSTVPTEIPSSPGSQ